MDHIMLLVGVGLALGSMMLLIVGLYISQIVFGGYLKQNHPDAWAKLTTDAEKVKGGRGFDNTWAVTEFRNNSTEDFGDPELARLRRLSKLVYRLVIYGFAATVVATLLAVLLTGYAG